MSFVESEETTYGENYSAVLLPKRLIGLLCGKAGNRLRDVGAKENVVNGVSVKFDTPKPIFKSIFGAAAASAGARRHKVRQPEPPPRRQQRHTN